MARQARIVRFVRGQDADMPCSGCLVPCAPVRCGHRGSNYEDLYGARGAGTCDGTVCDRVGTNSAGADVQLPKNENTFTLQLYTAYNLNVWLVAHAVR